MIEFEETQHQKSVSDYSVYLQLKQLNYSNKRIAQHLSYTVEDLANLISGFTFVSNIEHQINTCENDYFFNGAFYVTQGVKSVLNNEAIVEIYMFNKDLVNQHKGIDYLQTFYDVENDCKLLLIDQLSQSMIDSKQYNKTDNYCTLLLASEY